MGWGLVGALVLGGITYVSSSGIVAKVVSDLGRVTNPETPGLLSLLVLEDLAMALYLALIGVVLIGSGVSTAIASAVVALADGSDVLQRDVLPGRPGVRQRRLLHQSDHMRVELGLLYGLPVLRGRKGGRHLRPVHQPTALQVHGRVLLGLCVRCRRDLHAGNRLGGRLLRAERGALHESPLSS